MLLRRKITLGFIFLALVAYEIYDQWFTWSYNAACIPQGISVTAMAIPTLLLAGVAILLPGVLIRNHRILTGFMLLSILLFLVCLCPLQDHAQNGFDPWGECFTFDGDNYDQTLNEFGYFMVWELFLILAWIFVAADLLWTFARPAAWRVIKAKRRGKSNPIT